MIIQKLWGKMKNEDIGAKKLKEGKEKGKISISKNCPFLSDGKFSTSTLRLRHPELQTQHSF